MVIRTTKAVADLVDFQLDGTIVQAVADPNAEVPADDAPDTRDYCTRSPDRSLTVTSSRESTSTRRARFHSRWTLPPPTEQTPRR